MKIENLTDTYKAYLINRFNDKVFNKIVNDLVLLNVQYYNFNNEICDGKILCNKFIVDDLVDIFNKLYENKYKIEKIKLIDEYDFDDDKSMMDNNSSSFNFRKKTNKNEYSNHAYGYAIDINPKYNPYVNGNNIYPSNYETDSKYKIDHNNLCYKLFISHGFIWGGDWIDRKDYQHFEKVGSKYEE